jgi:hypothetical protein
VVEGLDQSVQVEVGGGGTFEPFGVGVIFEMADSIEEGDLNE